MRRFVGVRIAAIAGLLAILVLPYWWIIWNPDMESGQSYCPVKFVTGFPCPACGTGRAFVMLTHGRLADSLSYHPLGVAMYLVTVLILIKFIVELVRGREILRGLFYNKQVAWAIIAAFVITYIFTLWHFFLSNGLAGGLKESAFYRMFS